jgi:hypothetical protein
VRSGAGTEVQGGERRDRDAGGDDEHDGAEAVGAAIRSASNALVHGDVAAAQQD